jgi:DNA-binding transcriptional regulator YiaG
MSQLMIVMKGEMRRIARKEIKLAISGLMKDKVVLKKAVAALKKQAKQDRKTIAALTEAATRQAKQVAISGVQDKKARITARGVKALRRKLKLSQADFGKLVGVSGITIMKMENHQGPLNIREKTRQAYQPIMSIGVKEAKLRLEQLKPKVKIAKRGNNLNA